MIYRIVLLSSLCVAAAGCGKLSQVGKEPGFSPAEGSNQYHAIYSAPMPQNSVVQGPTGASSLWTTNSASLLGERRAAQRGDILTVLIEINDSAKISNTSGRTRTGAQDINLPDFFGIPQRLDKMLPDGATMADAANTKSSSTFKGTGNVSRSEKLNLRVAATVVEKLPNGVLRIEGKQEVRVNYELRELIVTGYVRPSDISRRNEIGYDKIADARISYGGRGQISDFQQPKYGQQIADILLPY